MDLLSSLNPSQREAVENTEGPLLVIAGAGSGKTRVLTYRIAYLIKEKHIPPYNILAVTFTNKAADEMRERIEKIVPISKRDIWMGTFHSICAKILRRDSEFIGYAPNFTIYDESDQLHLIKTAMKDLEISADDFPPNRIHWRISNAKNQLISPKEYEEIQGQGDFYEQNVSRIYAHYQKKLKENNAMDFDDLIMKTVELFQNNKAVLQKYQDRFKYVLVDEYQDTNHAQYIFINLLARKHRNLCVVGDEDQSIYGWRGADINNILEFENDYPESKIIRLEQNYRSTKTILSAANSVVSNNKYRKGKTLWTKNKSGDKLIVTRTLDEVTEAFDIVEKVKELMQTEKRTLRDFVVLYRTNAQSRAIEEGFRKSGIPYILVGGVQFYERKEIKDILAYLKFISNPRDSVSLERVMNVPKRGIGDGAIKKMEEFAFQHHLTTFESMQRVDDINGLRSATKESIKKFVIMLENFISFKNSIDINFKDASPSNETMIASPASEMKHIHTSNSLLRKGKILSKEKEFIIDVGDLGKKIIDETGYIESLLKEGTPEARNRIENVKELVSGMKEFVQRTGNPTLEAYLEEVSLITDIDKWDSNADVVSLMTMHSAKGLEFPIVIIAGAEEGLLPHASAFEDDMELEEERRLFYVAITRAKEKVLIFYTDERRRYGQTEPSEPSRFLDEIPEKLITRGQSTSWRNYNRFTI